MTIFNDLVDKIKVAQEPNDELQGCFTSLFFVKKEEDEVIRFESQRVSLKMRNFEMKSYIKYITQSTSFT